VIRAKEGKEAGKVKRTEKEKLKKAMKVHLKACTGVRSAPNAYEFIPPPVAVAAAINNDEIELDEMEITIALPLIVVGGPAPLSVFKVERGSLLLLFSGSDVEKGCVWLGQVSKIVLNSFTLIWYKQTRGKWEITTDTTTYPKTQATHSVAAANFKLTRQGKIPSEIWKTVAQNVTWQQKKTPDEVSRFYLNKRKRPSESSDHEESAPDDPDDSDPDDLNGKNN